MKNKILSVILVVCLLLSVVPTSVFVYAAEATETETETTTESEATLEWQYELYGDGVCITAYTGDQVDITIPATITVDGTDYNVIKLGDSIFENNDAINSVTLPETMLEIGEKAFYDCDQLVTIVTNEQLTAIGAEAFYSCGVFNSVIIYDAVASIGTNAFAECPSLTIWCNEGTVGYTYATENNIPYEILNPYTDAETITVDGITYAIIDGNAIGINCDKTLTEVVVPETVNEYPVTELRATFRDCTALTSVTLPEGLTEIGDYAFDGCYALTTIEIPDSVTSIGSCAFIGCDALTEIEIPNSVTNIGDHAFYSCDALTEIEIPNSVTNMGINAFSHCTSLTSIKISNGATKIGGQVFSHCTSLTEIEIPSSITSIGGYAFSGCTSLAKVIIPESVTKMYTTSFPANTILMVYEDSYAHTFAVDNDLLYFIYDGTNEPEVVITDGVTYVIANDEAVVIDCDSTLTEVVIPETVNGYPVTELRATFRDCTKLTSVTLLEGLTEIGDYAFYGCYVLTEIKIPDSVTSIGDHAFSLCRSLTAIEIPDSVTSIGNYAFSTCDALTAIEIPNSVTKISGYAFYNCDELATVNIPDNVTSIGNYAFYGCSSLSEIEIPSSVTSIGGLAFKRCTSLTKVVIPESVTKMYTTSFPANTILMVYEGSYAHTFAVNNDLLYFVYDGVNEPEIITSDGITYLIVNNEATAIDCDSTLTEVVIPETVNSYPVTSLKSTFSDCTKLTSVTLPEGLTEIGDYAFDGCYALTTIEIPDSVTSIGSCAFIGCDALTEIEIPNSVTNIGDHAFYSCDALTEIEIPNSVTNMGINAFSHCTSLTSIKISNGATKIGGQVFSHCTSLTEIEIPSSITSIGGHAFSGCTSLVKVIIPESVTSLLETSFPTTTILMVYEDSYAHTFAVDNDLLYFIMRKTANPEIAYGAGISGTVSYTDGSVASGATVEILYDDGYVKESVVADELGAYEFTYAEVGRYTIRATDANGNTASTTVNVKRMNAFDVYVSGDTTLTLKKGYSVTGTVNVGDAGITITDTNGNVIAETTADENGSFTLENIPNGEYIIKAETENGAAVQEITVFDGNVSDITITIETATAADTATIWGYVEVEDREYKHHRRNWVEVKLYNEDGTVVASCRSDADGKYSFSNLPIGEYVVVAETAEMRPDKHHHFDRSHTLTGYAYISVEATGEYQAETIVLYEENDYLGTISGKVTAKGESQACTVTLTNVFRDEVATVTTGNNGKYSFSNVRDGMYFITATTDSNGMGYTVVVVHHGKVYGKTDITVYKADKIKNREDKFKDDIPTCNSKDDAKQHRARIAEEKRFYDGLSHKEKKQLSREYVDRLNKLCEWIADCEYTTNDGVTVEQGGLVMSGDELENESSISFNITVEKTDAWEVNTDGVKDGKDFVHHNMKDKADDRVMQQYYEISMSKTVDGEEKQITSVYKDTDAMGKFRITMDIPEEYRGYKNYSVVHVHCGETVILTDLDDNPDTITFEVDKFSTFVLTATDETLGEAVPSDDALKFDGATLTLTDSIAVNYKVNKANVTDYTDLYVKFTFGGKEYVVSEYTDDGEYYVFTFDNVAPNRMNDIIYAALCGTKDGTNYESADYEYSIATYCYNMLAEYNANDYAGEKYDKFRTLLVDLLNFGAQSQLYTSYNTANLANASLTDTQKAWGTQTNREFTSVKNLKYKTIDNPSVSWKAGGLYLNDSVTMRFTIQTESIENLTVKVVCGNETWEITADSFRSIGDNKYYVYFSGLNPTQMSESVELTVYNGDTAVSNTILYSIESYAQAKAGDGNTLSELVIAMMKYGDAAKAYKENQ